MKIPKNDESTLIIEKYLRNLNIHLYGKEISKSKLAKNGKKYFDKDYDFIRFVQNGEVISQMVCVQKAKNDLGKPALFITPFVLEAFSRKKLGSNIQELLKSFRRYFLDDFEYTFLLNPDQKILIRQLSQMKFKLDATMLIGEVRKSLRIYKSKLEELPKGMVIKKFNFKRDYPLLRKMKIHDARKGDGDSRLDFSNKDTREKKSNFWKTMSSPKSPHDAIGLWDGDKFIGAMALMYLNLEPGVPCLHIGEVFLDLNHRGKGLSHYLYKEALQRAADKKVKYFTGATTTAKILNAAKNLSRSPYLHFYTKAF